MPTTDIEIIVPSRGKTGKVSDATRGPLGRRREAEYFPRRKTGATLYDFGLKLTDGVYKEPGWSVLNLTHSGAILTTTPPSLADWNDLKDEILATPTGEWESVFKKLDYETAEDYALDFFNDGASVPTAAGRNDSRYYTWLGFGSGRVANTTWKPSGLTGLNNPVLWGSPTLCPSYIRKVTATPDFADADIPGFIVKPNAKIFLMPFPTTIILWSQNPAASLVNIVISPYTTLKRSLFVGRKDDSGLSSLSNHSLSPGTQGDAIWSDDLRTEFQNHIKTLAGSRGFTWDNATDLVTEVGTASFPEQSVTRFYINSKVTFAFDLDMEMNYAEAPQGALVAAIKQDGQVYYVWENDPTAGTVQKNPVKLRVLAS